MYDVMLESDVMVSTRDGIRLATDIYRPAAPGAFPVLLERTPYDKSAPSRSERSVADPVPASRGEVAEYFVSRGYIIIVQDCRGRYNSGGIFTKYLSEGEDGYDTMAWIVGQSWCDGRIGTMGLSYAAHTQVAAACLDPPGLAAMFVDSGGFSNAYQGGIRQGGAFELKQATWAYKQALASREAIENPIVAAALESEDIAAWFARMPWKPGHSPLRHVPEYEDYLFEQWRSGRFDGFWKKLGIHAEGYYDVFADVPMVHMSSWYDPYPRTATTNYTGLRKRLKSSVSLILGPWTHGDRCLSWAGDVDFGPEATLEGVLARDFLSMRLVFFDRWLKSPRTPDDSPKETLAPGECSDGAPHRYVADARVRYFRMGGGSGTRNAAGRLEHGGIWKTATDWPIPGARKLELLLRADGGMERAAGQTACPEAIQGRAEATTGMPADSLSVVRSTAEAPRTGNPAASSLSYRYDPAHPVPSIGGSITSGEPVMRGGAYDQVESDTIFGSTPPYLPLASRPDVLVFQTPPLASDIEITGPVAARLFVSSDCPDTDFTIKLVDVHPASPDYPRGYAMNLCDGILRARYRDSWEEPRMMEPGRVYEILVEAFPTSNLFCAGHRIRLDVSSSNFPHFDANPNSGAPEGSPGPARVAVNTLHLDASHPSRLILSEIPAS